MSSEAEARKEILDKVAEYCRTYHNQNKTFEPGDRINYAGRVYDEEEMVNLVDSSLEFWLTAGRYTAEFEKAFGEYLGVPFVSLVNSGSSANLCAFMALTSPLLKERQIRPGDEVITVACGFPTTVTPIIQYGAVPVFVDVTIPQYNIDVNMLEAALSPKTKAVMIAHTLGNPFDVFAVKRFCEKHNLWLIEDNCDALGSRVKADPSSKVSCVLTADPSSKAVLSQTRAPARIVCESTLSDSGSAAEKFSKDSGSAADKTPKDFGSAADTSSISVDSDIDTISNIMAGKNTAESSEDGNVRSQMIRSGERICERTLSGDEDSAYAYTGTIGDIGTSSFYPPHHMTMGEGGAVYTRNPLLHKIIRSMRDWGRDCSCAPGQDNLCNHRFDKQYGLLPLGYDHKYVYSHFGYNLKATDMQAAVGCAQIKKFPSFVARRKENHAFLTEALKGTDGIILPEKLPGSDPSWFGFMITVEGDAAETVRRIEARNVQTRRLFAGNLIYHPCFDQMRAEGRGYRVAGELTNTDRIMNQSFWVGVYPGMSQEKLAYMAEVIKNSIC